MKIETIGLENVWSRIGYGVSKAEAEAMREILLASPYLDTDDISESEWSGMVRLAIHRAAKQS